jgi:hypothetical protein
MMGRHDLSASSTKRTHLALVVLLAVILGCLGGGTVAIIGAATSSASGLGSACATYDGPEFTGYTDTAPAQSALGAAATIDHHDPVLCTGAPNDNPAVSTVWTMIADYDSDLAQVGYVMYGSWSTSTVYFFWECITCDNSDGEPLSTLPQQFEAMGDPSNFDYQDTYTTLDNTTDNDTVEMEVQPYEDPDLTENLAAYGVISGLWDPTNDEFEGEIHWDESQTMGVPSHKCYFYDIEEWYPGTGFDTVYLSNSSWIHNHTDNSVVADVNEYEFRIWDSRGS